MKNSFFTFAILFLVLMPLAASVDKALPNENENGGKKSIFNTYTSKIAESGKFDKINAVFAEMSDSNECKKDIMEAIVIFAHDEHGKSVQADVYVDDNKIGTTPGSFYVPICSFKLMLKAKNKYFYQKLDMHKGNPIFINAVLKPELQWSQKASKIKSPENYCKNLNEGGHKDWRLPTIDDFKTAINCPSKLAGGDCEFSVESYKSLEKSEGKTEFATNEKELWKSASKGTKVTFLGDNETFAAAYPDCPNSYNFVYITKEDGKTAVYFRATCVLNDSQDAKGNLPDDCSVRCVR